MAKKKPERRRMLTLRVRPDIARAFNVAAINADMKRNAFFEQMVERMLTRTRKAVIDGAE